VEQLTALALRSPRVTLLIAAALAAAGALGAASGPRGSGAYALLGDDHPEVREFAALRDTFGEGHALTVAWSCGGSRDPCRSVFDEASLRMADALHASLSAIRHAAQVSSPARTPLLVATTQGVTLHRFVQQGEVRAPSALVDRALEDWRGRLVARDDTLGAVVVEIAPSDGGAELDVIEAVERALAAHETRGFHFLLAGVPWLQAEAQRGSQLEALRIGATATALVVAVVFVLLRSIVSVIAVLATIALSSVCALGAMGALGWARDPVTTGAPAMILVMGAVDAIHLLSCYWRQRAVGHVRDRAMRNAALETGRPCALATLATAASLLMFASTGAPALAKFGAIAALGAALCMLCTYTLVPALVTVLPDSATSAVRESVRWEGWLRRATRYPVRFPQEFIGAATLIASIAVVGAVRLAPDSSALDAWKADAPLRRHLDFVAAKLRSVEGLEIEVKGTGPVHDGEVFAEIARIEDQIARIEGVKSVRSLRTALDRAAPALGAERASGEMAAAAFELVTRAGPGALAGLASADLRRARFSISLPNLRYAERARILAEVDAVLAESSLAYVITGPTPLQLAIDRQMKHTALTASLLSAAFVFGLVAYVNGSWRWGVLALLPNIPPVLILYGTMGFLEVSHDYAAAIVPPLVLALSANDTIRVLFAFRRERWSGHDAVTAITNATRRIGHGLVTASLALALSLLSMVPSEFQTVADAGGLSALAIVTAAATELTLLPALVSRISQSRPELTKGSRTDAPTH
jgi:hypothetical protein